MGETPSSETVSTKLLRIAIRVRYAANPCFEEPDAGILHVRICGSLGGVTSRGHPATPMSRRATMNIARDTMDVEMARRQMDVLDKAASNTGAGSAMAPMMGVGMGRAAQWAA